MSLRKINLNLVPILQALLRERSVTRAGAALAMSQSAVSDALAQLRLTLGDPLLVRLGGHMALTPVAVDLIAPLETLCGGLDQFFSNPRFDPATANRSFVVATSDYVPFRLARPLLDLLREQALGVTLRFIDVNDELAQGLANRDIDFACFPSFFVEDLAPAPLHFRPMFEEVAVALFCKDHPLGQRATLDASDLAPDRLIACHPGSGKVERKRAHIFMAGVALRAAAFVPQITLVPQMLKGSMDFGIVPAGLAESATTNGALIARPLSFAALTLKIGLAWSAVQDADPAHRWFRECVLAQLVPVLLP